MRKQEVEKISKLGSRFSDVTISMHEAIAQKAGLSGTEHKYLGLLVRNGDMTAGELAKQTGLTTGAITGLVDRLEAKGLVKRGFDKTDRRKIIIVPEQETIAQLLNPLFSDLQTKMVQLVATLTEQEKQIIERYMLATIGVMEEVTQSLTDK
jgi:DNA-binding MarR family transcriptional regulator